MEERTAVSQPHNHHRAAVRSRLGMRHTGGEIVEVQGGHIVRATGRKDRHSKVCTAKGPRDRRVRLAAHTAIQFYDVQDRLGYDRPSKAVDWLIKHAKDAIDELAELPAWNPTLGPVSNAGFEQNPGEKHQEEPPSEVYGGAGVESVAGSSSRRRRRASDADIQNQPQQFQISSNSSFLPPSMDSDAIADTIKSFFPIGASPETTDSPRLQFQNQSFPPPQDLRLSLQSLQDPILLHHHQQQQQTQHHQTEHAIFSGTTPMGYDTPSAIWPETHTDVNRFQRIPAWNPGGDTNIGGSGGFVFNSPPTPPLLQPLFGGHNQFFQQQRGPLQSSNTQSIRAWIDPPSIATASSDHHHHQHQTFPIHHPSSLSGIGFGGFSGFHIPARIQGEEEEHDGVSDKPSSASSDSRH